MANIHVPSFIFFITAFILFVLLYFGSKKKYSQYIQPLDKKRYPLKDFMTIGFLLMRIIRYKYNLRIDREMRKKMLELYEEEFNEYYLQVQWAAAATYFMLGLFITSILTLASEGKPAGLLIGMVITFVLVISVKNDIDKQIEERHLQIAIDLPDIVNQIVILSGAGLTLRAAILKISREMPKETPLYTELSKVTNQMESGISDITALENMTLRCNMPEMRRFVSVIIQNLQRGGIEVLYALQDISKEMWDNRKAAAKRIAEEAGTKMLFPMMLMLFAVIILTITPAVLSLKI